MRQKDAFLMRDPDEAAKEMEPQIHVFGDGIVCDTDSRGYATPDNRDPLELVVDASEVKPFDDCSPNGCVLASAFFPDGGRHELTIYPRMFTQSDDEQMETLEHEIGHTFGLRHFFAKLSETAAPAELFGAQNAFTIMNYGSRSRLTEQDRSDLKSLYQQAWSGQLTQINGTPIRFVRPFSSLAPASDARFALASVPVG